MTWKITKVFIDASDNIGIEVTNTSGSTQSTSDLFLWSSSISVATAAPTIPLSNIGAPANVAPGASFVFGDQDIAEVSGSTTNFATSQISYLGIGTSSTLIDGVGDDDSGSAPWTTNTIFTANPSRTQDTNASDAFSFATDFTSSTYCFAAGTRIKVQTDEVCVETLTIGGLIRTEAGATVPVKWIGRQTLSKWHYRAHAQPVRIRAGALGGGLPHSDLTVTADHGMVFPSSREAVGAQGGLVINASALVNGSSIDFVPMAELEDSFTVYHIETENHDVILANGAPSETFIDMAGRSAFDNYQEYLDLYGAERLIPEMPLPRIAAPRLVPQAIQDRLGAAADETRTRAA